ncbi:hypothetical protein ATEIFO6365_0007051000 [Aspergillus terreus]|uniref:Uncharacterized protein n=1 Tax=Aspergillus terreus TaxID=33178 RepID=A0A5M3Z553_ASPTE|nr:hypothetical protein ATETN484_0009051000 [Aspergillus terreus]GFF17961.1 hypothetical protein ATEIFO6365_0007051000 [Aspergillus terreus]
MSHTSGPPHELAPQSGAAVPFQVTIDAGAASSGLINFSINALARISHAGLDHFAYGVCVLVGHAISYSPVGMERFHQALEKAPVQAGFQKLLWFGFGHKSPIQILLETESGCRFTALSACLSEVYSTSMAGQIMLAFSHKVFENVPDEQQIKLPSQMQMTLLVEKCAGILSATSFPLWAEQYMAFDHESIVGQHAWRHGSNKTRRTRGVASATDIANALYAIMRLRSGSTRHLTLVGVADAALIAAIANWLLELKVILYTSDRQQEDDVWFRNFSDDEEPHLTVIYSRNPRPTSSLIQRDRTIQLPDATSLFRSHAELKPNHDFVVSGRVSWTEALYRTFGDQSSLLLSMHAPFGSAMGSAARIFYALEKADSNVPREWLHRSTAYFPVSYGHDFINFSGIRFPELSDKDLHAAMLNTFSTASSYRDACDAFKESIDVLAHHCSCKICLPTLPQGTTPRSTSFCLVVLTTAIIRLVRGLSGIIATEGLCPSRKGLEYIYRLQQMRVSRVLGGSGGPSIVDAIIEYAISDLQWTEASQLRFAEYVFNGRPFADEPEESGVSATASNGLCFYLDILRDFTAVDAMEMCRVNVIPGHIIFENRLYSCVGEKATLLSKKGAYNKRPQVCIPERVVQAVQSCMGGTAMLNVTETMTYDRQPALEVYFEILRDGQAKARVSPCKIVQNIPRGIGVVQCQNDGCNKSEEARKLLDQSEERGPLLRTIVADNRQVYLFRDDVITRLLALFHCWEPLIQRDECLACCVRYGCEAGWDSFAVLCRTHDNRSPRELASLSLGQSV